MGQKFGVNDWENKPASNLLDKGRYKFKVKEIEHHQSSKGNSCAKVVIDIEGHILTDFLLLEGAMVWKWKQFLFAVGIRNKGRSFEVDEDIIVNSEGLADIYIKDREMGDGSTMKENRIQGYSPIKEETAPITDVPSETAKPQKEKPIEKEEEEEEV